MSENETIRVMIVDDHMMMRTGLRYTLSSFVDLELVAEAGSGSEAIQICPSVKPDVILMDMVMPGMDGVDTTVRIKELCPKIQIIALTSFQEKDMIERAIQAGAIGYLLKNVDAQELARAIRAAHVGRPTLAEEATEALIDSTRQKTPIGQDLTPREREILILMSKGLTNQEIAKQLVISISTVKFHAKGILSKLEAANRAEAVNIAWKHNLIPD